MASGRLSPSRLSSSNISALLSDDPSAVGAHFEELLSAAIVVLEGEDDHVLFASAAALALTGHTREDVFNLYTFSACFEGDSSASSVAEVLAGREAEAVECRLCTKAGQPIHCVLVHVPCAWCADPDDLSVVFLFRPGASPPSQRLAEAHMLPAMLQHYLDEAVGAVGGLALLACLESGEPRVVQAARSLSAPGDRLPRSGSAGAASRHASNSSADAHRPGPLGTLPRSGLGSSPPPPQRLSAGAMRRPRY